MNNAIHETKMQQLDLVELAHVDGGLDAACTARSVIAGALIGAVAGPEASLGGAVIGGVWAYFNC